MLKLNWFSLATNILNSTVIWLGGNFEQFKSFHNSRTQPTNKELAKKFHAKFVISEPGFILKTPREINPEAACPLRQQCHLLINSNLSTSIYTQASSKNNKPITGWEFLPIENVFSWFDPKNSTFLFYKVELTYKITAFYSMGRYGIPFYHTFQDHRSTPRLLSGFPNGLLEVNEV